MDRKVRERTFHDSVFETKKRRPLHRFYDLTNSIKKQFEKALLRKEVNNALELGCGLGSQAIVLAKNDVSVSAIDLSTYAINCAAASSQKANTNIKYCVMDAECLGYDDDTFDLIFGRGILHHLDIRAAITEIRRVLKFGGSVIFIEPLIHNPLVNCIRSLTPQLRTKDERPLCIKDLQWIACCFSKTRFQFFYLFSLLTFPLFMLPFSNIILHVFEELDRIIMMAIPALQKYSWQVLIVLEK